MESSHKYTVAGHTFVITLPEGFRQETYLSPYSPFASEESSDEPLITLHVALADNLKNVAKGKVKEIFNDEAPYFWLLKMQITLLNGCSDFPIQRSIRTASLEYHLITAKAPYMFRRNMQRN